jgi:hypothetical protein
MNKYIYLFLLSQILVVCTKQATPLQNRNQAQTQRIHASDTLTWDPVTVLVDTTFIAVAPTISDKNCKIDGPVAARAEGRIGYVSFSKEAGMYCITYTGPGAVTDEQWTGYVCNLPDSFKKDRLKVGFVGSYYAAYKNIKGRHASDTPLYLVLEKIKAL